MLAICMKDEALSLLGKCDNPGRPRAKQGWGEHERNSRDPTISEIRELLLLIGSPFLTHPSIGYGRFVIDCMWSEFKGVA